VKKSSGFTSGAGPQVKPGGKRLTIGAWGWGSGQFRLQKKKKGGKIQVHWKTRQLQCLAPAQGDHWIDFEMRDRRQKEATYRNSKYSEKRDSDDRGERGEKKKGLKGALGAKEAVKVLTGGSSGGQEEREKKIGNSKSLMKTNLGEVVGKLERNSKSEKKSDLQKVNSKWKGP